MSDFLRSQPGSRLVVSVPQRALDLAVTRRLGEPVRAFDARIGFRRAIAWLVLLGLAGVLLVLSAAYYLVEGPLWLGISGALLAAGYLGGMAWILRGGALRGWGRAVYLFEHGLVCVSRRGWAARHWDELRTVTMAGVQPAPHRHTAWRFTVTDAGGRRLVLGDELPEVRLLGEAVVTEVARRMVPRYLAVIEAGGTVELGPFTVSRGGLAKDGEIVPWPAVREVGLSNGMVYVRRIDDIHVMATTVGRMPNALAFAELCHRVRAHGDDNPLRPRRR